MAIKVTKEAIEQLNAIYKELDDLEEESTLKVNRAMEGKKEREVEITRRNGETQRVKESLLWDEVWTLGANSEAGEFLRGKYPDAFAAADKHNAKAEELSSFTLLHFGIDARKIKLRDIFNIVDALIDYKLKAQKEQEA